MNMQIIDGDICVVEEVLVSYAYQYKFYLILIFVLKNTAAFFVQH